ncbi:MAG: hypothetical protein JNM51_15620, partial [Bacteroidia bacterium]|nr:hypothetical protein [Bacteroidia bacterium]
NNVFNSSNFGRIKFIYADTVDFSNNKINGTGSLADITYCNKISVLKNNINTVNGIALGIAYVSDCVVANNMLVASGNSSNEAFLLSSLFNSRILNNSVYCSNSISTGYALSYASDNVSGLNKFWNNIIVNNGPGAVINYFDNGKMPRFRNNCFYSTSGNFGKFNNVTVQSFSNWLSAIKSDTNSIFINPLFTSTIDLHVKEISLKGSGIPVSFDITDDIDGELRNVSNPDIGADEFAPLLIDASTTAFGFNSLLCSGNNSVQVYLKNNGSSNLTSAKLNWSINSSSMPQVNWNGNLASGAQALVNLGNYNFNLNTAYSLKAWSALPNGINDVLTVNDTVYKSISSPALTGTFTIGGTSPTYTSLTQAFNTLKNSGLCGPVVYKIRNGVYNEQITIPYIKGSSSTNTILIESESRDSSLVSIEFNSSFSNNYVLSVDSTDYITFSKIGFKQLNATYANVISIKNKANNVFIKNCVITGQTNTGILVSFNFGCDSSEVITTKFINGSNGLVFNGNGNKARKNIFENQSNFSISSTGNYLSCESNQISNSNLTPTAININSSFGCSVNKNKIIFTGTGNSTRISIATSGSTVSPNFITNNFVSINGSGTGIKLNNCQYLNLIYNSVNQIGSGTCLSYTTVTNSNNKNNIYNNASGNCVKSSSLTPSFVSNYNCVYSPTNKLWNIGVLTYSTIASYNAVSGQEVNSVSADPLYISNTDLHVANIALLNGSAQYNVNVTDDIDGELRNVTNPDIGADEFVLLNINDDAEVFNAFVSNIGCGGSQTLFLKLKNTGINNLTSVKLSAEVGGVIYGPILWTGNLLQGQIEDSISLGTINNLYGNAKIKAWSTLPNGNVDVNTLNDTVIYYLPNTALKGRYKIGGNNPDFVSLRAAKNALVSFGICDSVIFDIRPGTYQDTLTIPSVVGSSSVNTITFQSENGDSSSVVITDFAAAP